MQSHSTPMSRILGLYFHFKGVEWAVVGLFLLHAAISTGEIDSDSPVRLFAYFLLIFAAPGILLWILGTIVRLRRPIGWWLGTGYLTLVLFMKTSLGFINVPAEVWHWASSRLPPSYYGTAAIVGVLAAVVFATDVATFVVIISPRCRESFAPHPHHVEHSSEEV